LTEGFSPSPTHTVERRHLGSDLHVLVAEDPGFLVAFTERGGGVSEQPFRSLNLGYRTQDDAERVGKNRRRVIDALGIPPFATARQVHGATLHRVGRSLAAAGFAEPSAALPEADILSVSEPRVPVAVLVADCLPVALASRSEQRLAAVHAGWRGLAAGALARAASEFEDRGGVRAFIGPAIGPCHYEVGEEVIAELGAAAPVTERRGGRTFLDLAATAEGVLRREGIGEVASAGICTHCAEDRFFSYRRDGRTGRQAMLAMRL
jgi:YfiH family protein